MANGGKELKCTENEDTCPNKATALSDAVVLRLGLGQEEQAITDANTFDRRYGARKGPEAAQIAFAIGAHYAEREQWQSAERQLSRAMRQIESKANLDVQVRAGSLIGRTYAEQGEATEADRYYAKARDAWTDPAGQRRKLAAPAVNECQCRGTISAGPKPLLWCQRPRLQSSEDALIFVTHTVLYEVHPGQMRVVLDLPTSAAAAECKADRGDACWIAMRTTSGSDALLIADGPTGSCTRSLAFLDEMIRSGDRWRIGMRAALQRVCASRGQYRWRLGTLARQPASVVPP